MNRIETFGEISTFWPQNAGGFENLPVNAPRTTARFFAALGSTKTSQPYLKFCLFHGEPTVTKRMLRLEKIIEALAARPLWRVDTERCVQQSAYAFAETSLKKVAPVGEDAGLRHGGQVPLGASAPGCIQLPVAP